jgi:hypothetical protein
MIDAGRGGCCLGVVPEARYRDSVSRLSSPELPAYRAGQERCAATPVEVTSDSDVPSEHASGSDST